MVIDHIRQNLCIKRGVSGEFEGVMNGDWMGDIILLENKKLLGVCLW